MLTPDTFAEHELGYKLISYNAPVDEANGRIDAFCEQKICGAILLHFPKHFYQKIKAKKLPTKFNFSGEKFLNALTVKNHKEIHINLYHHQVEFFAFENKKVVLYNNLDAEF